MRLATNDRHLQTPARAARAMHRPLLAPPAALRGLRLPRAAGSRQSSARRVRGGKLQRHGASAATRERGARRAEEIARAWLAAPTDRYSHAVFGHRLAAGSLVIASMLEARSGDLTTLPRQAVLDENAAVGRVTTRTLARGSVVQASQLQAPALIQRNRTVSVEAVGQGFRVVRQGEALQDGALGDTVRVRMGNRSILTGVVAGDGVVKVSF